MFYQKYFKVDTDSVLASKKVKLNIYTMNSNLAGIEFVKIIELSDVKYPRIVEILHGTAIILLQQYKSPDNRVMKIVAKKAKRLLYLQTMTL